MQDLNTDNTFIGSWFLPNISICDQLIELHSQNTDKLLPGVLGDNTTVRVDKFKKDCTDLTINGNIPHPVITDLLNQLQEITNKYIDKFSYANYYSKWGIISPFNIRHYAPGQGYHAWHTERSNSSPIISTRHLVWMIYLNDVTDCGETEFFHQKIKIKPQKGLVLIWPADWTHTHRGISSPTQDKYIITGWYNYYEQNRINI